MWVLRRAVWLQRDGSEMATRIHGVLQGAMLAMLAGCSFIYGDDLDKEQCERDADCASDAGVALVCRMNACQAPLCAGNDDCPSGFSCEATMCMPNAADAGVRTACTQDVDCGEGSRCGFDGFCYEKWGCLASNRDWPIAAQSFSYQVPIRRITDLEVPSAVPEMSIIACNTIDPTCTRPAVRKEDVTVSEDKVVTVPFSGIGASGFTGFIRFDPIARSVDGGVADAGTDEVLALPGVLHFTAETPLVGNTRAQSRLLTIDPSTFGALAIIADVQLDLTAATIAVRIHDCGGRTAAGVSMIPTGVTTATFVPIQNESTPVVGGTRTTSDGSAIIINVPPDRNQTFVLRDEDTGRVIAQDIAFVARGAAINYLFYYPRYRALDQWNREAKRRGLLD